MNTLNATIPAAFLKWVDAAIASGLSTDLISRKQALKVKQATGARLPRWLMKDPSRRRGRGVYSCPEIPERIKELEAARNAKPANMAFRGKGIPQIARMALRGRVSIRTKIKRRK